MPADKVSKEDIEELIESKGSYKILEIFEGEPAGRIHNKSLDSGVLHFDKIEDFEEFLNDMDENTFNTIPPIEFTPAPNPETGTGEGRYVDSRYIGGLGVFINIAFYPMPNCTANNLISYLDGFTLGVSYSHFGGISETIGKSILYRVDGVLNYNVFVEGIGTIYTQEKTYSGIYNCVVD